MYCTYLLGLFLILGVDGGSSIRKIAGKDDFHDISASNVKQMSTRNSGVALNPRQLVEIENTLNIVYKHFFGSPPKKLTLRSNNDAQMGLASTVSIIGDTISAHIKNLFKKFGIASSFNAGSYRSNLDNSTSLRYSIFYQLMRVPLEIKSIFHEIQSRVKKYIQKNNYVKLGYERAKFSLQTDGLNSTRDLEILKILDAVKTYTAKLSRCLEKNDTRSFNLKKSMGKLANLSPEVVGTILYRRLDRPLPRNPEIRKSRYNELHAFVCHAFAEDSRINYRYCLVEIKHVDECARAKFDVTSMEEAHGHTGETSRNFIETIKSLDESCVNVTGQMDFSLVCKEKGTKTNGNDISNMMDFLMDDMRKSPVLSRMANELLSMMRKTRLSAKVVREIASLVKIYRNAMKQRARLVKMGEKDVEQRYNEISENLADYKQHVARMSFKTINQVNEIVSNVENILVDTTSNVSRKDFSGNVRALKCFSVLMETVFGDWPGPNSLIRHGNDTKNFTSPSKSTVSRNSVIVPNEVGFVKSSHDEPLNKWIDSMKRLGQTTSPRRSSALISLANTFLLATMFYECIAVLAGAIYREESGTVSQSLSAENNAPDNWVSRDTRTDHQDHRIGMKEDETSPVWSSITDINEITTTESPMYNKMSQINDNSLDLKIAQTTIKKRKGKSFA